MIYIYSIIIYLFLGLGVRHIASEPEIFKPPLICIIIWPLFVAMCALFELLDMCIDMLSWRIKFYKK